MAKINNLIDVRLNNTSQLAGFAKRDDLAYILEMVGIKYIHDPSLAPSSDLLKDFKNRKITWREYEERYINTLDSRKIKNKVKEILGNGIPVFLCSEEKAEQCHRRLLAEYIQKHSDEELIITHLS